eukprot:6280334-Pyramimonas_sp.AAC.1
MMLSVVTSSAWSPRASMRISDWRAESFFKGRGAEVRHQENRQGPSLTGASEGVRVMQSPVLRPSLGPVNGEQDQYWQWKGKEDYDGDDDDADDDEEEEALPHGKGRKMKRRKRHNMKHKRRDEEEEEE